MEFRGVLFRSESPAVRDMCRTQPREAIPGCRWRSLGVLLVVLALASGCRRESAEHALRGDIASLQAAIESRDAGGMAKFLAADFVGNDGLDRDGARRLAALHFLRNAAIGVTSGPLDFHPKDDHYTVGLTVVLTGGSGGLLHAPGRAQACTTGFELVDGSEADVWDRK